jgi:hypothetical protein
MMIDLEVWLVLVGFWSWCLFDLIVGLYVVGVKDARKVLGCRGLSIVSKHDSWSVGGVFI